MESAVGDDAEDQVVQVVCSPTFDAIPDMPWSPKYVAVVGAIPVTAVATSRLLPISCVLAAAVVFDMSHV